jgi:hypothetical protein
MRRALTCSGERFSSLRAERMRAVAPARRETEVHQYNSISAKKGEKMRTNEGASHTRTSHDSETTNDSRENVQSGSNNRRNSKEIVRRSVVRVGTIKPN